jgi:hypothetical protein
MKGLLNFHLIFSVALFFYSCGSSNDIKKSEIIGNSIKLGHLEIAKNSFPKKMNWFDANKACENLGNGWRLPTVEEFDFMFRSKIIGGGFMDMGGLYYWSSAESGELHAIAVEGLSKKRKFPTLKRQYCIVIAVKNINGDTSTKTYNKTTKINSSRIFESVGIKAKNEKHKFEVYEKDLNETMTYYEAKKACKKLGKNWRVPLKEELDEINKHRNTIAGLRDTIYWSCTLFSMGSYNRAYFYIMNFQTGNSRNYGEISEDKYYVRPVRTID